MRLPWGMALACAASAVVGGLLVAWVTAEGDRTVSASSGRAPAEPAQEELGALQRRVGELEGRLERLNRQLHARQRLERRVKAARDGTGGAQGDLAPESIAADNPAFELAVRSVMDRVEWEQEQAREATQAQFRDERARRQTDLLSDRLGLDTEQANAVRAVLTDQMERFRQLRSRDHPSEGPVTRDEWRQQIGRIREETEAQLRQILSEAQLREYERVAEEEGIGGRWMRFGARARQPSNAKE